ncbi:MAG: TolC family protein [Sphingobacteriales bacterium]|nr:TolC family protein [Sphingobacteriales bacterium]
MIKKLTLIISYWLLYITYANGQALTLDSCLEMAKQNYPLIKQYALIEKTREYTLDNAHKGYLPQINVAGQATYQSNVTEIPISLPNLDIPQTSKDQYKLYTEISQSVTDLFTIKDQKEYLKANSEIETQKTTVELYKLRERINNLYFGVLLIDAQLVQTELLKKDIQNGIEKTKVAIANGVALKSAADNLKAELLKANQRTIELKATRQGYIDMLALFTGKPFDPNTIFEKPGRQILSNLINRPELKLFALQKKSFEAQNKLLTNKNLPRVSLFLQGGFGGPGLNMLKNDFQGYFIGGLRVGWNLSGFYTIKNEKEMLALNQNIIEVQTATFLFNTNLTLKQQNAEIVKMQELIVLDKNITTLRESVKNTTQNQLTYGTATTNDYLVAVNAEDLAKQNLIIHEVQLLMLEYNAQTTAGN